MKVTINGIEYDAEVTPIRIELNSSDKFNLSHMDDKDFTYCCYPSKMDFEEVKKQLKL